MGLRNLESISVLCIQYHRADLFTYDESINRSSFISGITECPPIDARVIVENKVAPFFRIWCVYQWRHVIICTVTHCYICY